MNSTLNPAIRLLAVLFVLFLSVPLVSASDQTAALEVPAVQTGAAAQVDAGLEAEVGLDPQVGDCASGTAEIDFTDLEPGQQWQRQDVSSCTHPCPGGIVILCPDKIDHVKACINNCCYLFPI